MDTLILHPSDMSQWHALVNEAEAACSMQLGEELESYLVFLLMRYMNQPELVSSILANEFLDSQHAIGQKRYDMLRNLGDKCLLFSGLFPENAEKRHVKVSYFINMGQTAYNTLSYSKERSFAELFAALCEDFICLTSVLQTMRRLSDDIPLILPIKTSDLCYEYHSEKAIEVLRRYINEGKSH